MTTTAAPDIAQLQSRELPTGKFPGDAKSPFRICIDSKAHKEIHAHAAEKIEVEICGVLVGRWGRDDKGPFLFVSASIRGEAATNKFAEVTFTHDTWSKINSRMDKDFVGQSIVGWYHTHPDFGIFLSDRDRFIHEHFFNEPGQVALVVDPVREEEGVFIWSGGKAVPTSHYWVGDKIRVPKVQDDGKETRSRSSAKHESAKSTAPPETDRPVLGGVTLAMGALCALMLGWILHDRLAGGDVQKVVELIQFDRLRMARDLGTVQQSLQKAVDPLSALALTNRTPEVQSALMESFTGLRAMAEQLNMLRQRYAIDEHELAQLITLLTEQKAQIDAMRQREMATTTPATQPTTAPAAATTAPATREAQSKG